MPRVKVTKSELTTAVLNKLMAEHFPDATEKQRAEELASRYAEASGKVRRSKSLDTYKTEKVDQVAVEQAQRHLSTLMSRFQAQTPIKPEQEVVEVDDPSAEVEEPEISNLEDIEI